MTDAPAESEAALRASLAKEGVEHAQALAKALQAVLDAATHPAAEDDPRAPDARSATQTLGLYLVATRLLSGIAPAGRLAWLAAVEQAVFPPGPRGPTHRQRINPAPKSAPKEGEAL